jgi:hypothetical protein
MDERDFDFLTPEFFDDGTLPEPLGPSADDLWQQANDPTYVSEYLKKQRAIEKDKAEELVRRRALALMAYQEFAAQDNGYFHSPENADVMFRSLRNGKNNPQSRFLDYTADGFNLVFELARKKDGLLEIGPNRGYTNAQIEKMNTQEYRDKIVYPKPQELLEEEGEIRQQKAVKAAVAEFRPSRRDLQVVWEAATRSGKVSLTGVMSLFPSYTREQCAAIADSIPDLLCVGFGNRKTWWPR